MCGESGWLSESKSLSALPPSEYRLSYQCAIRRNDLDPEDWPIERHETDRSGRELVLLMTKEEIASPPGSDAHRNRTHPTGREDTRAGHQEM